MTQTDTPLTAAELAALELEFPDAGRKGHIIHRLIHEVREAREQGARAMQQAAAKEAILCFSILAAKRIRAIDPAQVADAQGGER